MAATLSFTLPGAVPQPLTASIIYAVADPRSLERCVVPFLGPMDLPAVSTEPFSPQVGVGAEWRCLVVPGIAVNECSHASLGHAVPVHPLQQDLLALRRVALPPARATRHLKGRLRGPPPPPPHILIFPRHYVTSTTGHYG